MFLTLGRLLVTFLLADTTVGALRGLPGPGFFVCSPDGVADLAFRFFLFAMVVTNRWVNAVY